jgi:uncharacterized membrane protein YfcA
MKISSREKALFEHYVLATAASAVAIYQTGNHHLKEVAWAALCGVVGPLLARINPDSLLNKALPAVTVPVVPATPTTTKTN